MLISELAAISGVSKRTLRYYDEIGLLCPAHMNEAGYRIYSEEEVNILQQILFCRNLGLPLEDIKQLLQDEKYDRKKLYQQHRKQLLEKRTKIDDMLALVEQSLQEMEGEIIMTNKDKFSAFKDELIEKNEDQFGKEVREKYGEESVMASYGKLKDMSEEQYQAVQQLEQMLFARLAEAMLTGDVKSDVAQETAELHKRWLSFYWAKYSKEAHAGLAQMYVADERFVDYYDRRVGEGATQFLYEAILHYTFK